MQQQHQVTIGCPLIQIMDAQRAPLAVIHLQVVRLEGVINQIVESLIGCAFEFHNRNYSLQCAQAAARSGVVMLKNPLAFRTVLA